MPVSLNSANQMANAARVSWNDLRKLLARLIGSEVYDTGTDSPKGVVTPANTGQFYRDTTNGVMWRSTGLTNTSWEVVTPQFKSGTASGNGAVITVELGFVPKYVEVFNITDMDIKHVWTNSMSDGVAMEQKLLSYQKLTANGITPVSTAGTEGFLIGSTISESAKQLQWFAIPA